ncbi:MAG: hypothetical protein U0840_22800 [Gemmataceae bacterium]
MADIASLTAQLNQLRAQLEQTLGTPPSPAFSSRLHEIVGQMKACVTEAQGNLEKEAMALVGSLRTQAQALRAAEEKKPPAPSPLAHPWEDHQGLDAGKLHTMIDSLVQLGKTPPSAGRKLS